MKKVVIEQEYMTPYFSEKVSLLTKETKENMSNKKIQKNRFTIGNTYSLSGVECDDFEMPNKEYELVGLVSELNGIVLDSVIMKQISGEQNTIFSLTKADCRNLNIEFQKGLQLFPKNLNWVEKVNKEKSKEIKKQNKEIIFDTNNLSTYPTCHVDNTIRHIMIELKGFTYDVQSSNIITPYGDVIKSSNFLNKLKIRTKRPLYGDGNNSSHFNFNELINYRYMTNKISTCVTNSLIDKDNLIYLELFLGKESVNTKDRVLGVHPTVFNNQSLYDVFDIFYIMEEQPKKTITSNKRNDTWWRPDATFHVVDTIIDSQMKNIDRILSGNMSNLDVLLEQIRRENSVNELKRKYNF